MRRLRDAPLWLLLFRLQLITRKALWWPRVAWARRLGRRGTARAVSEAFESMGESLRMEVLKRAVEDREYLPTLRVRVGWVLQEGRFPCLGYGFVPLPRGDGWRSDPTSGYTWTNHYFPFVNFITHGADADVKVPWELSRLQWLVWLAEAATLDDCPDSARALNELESTLDDWSRSNPVGYGPNWTVAMEVAIRAVNVGIAAALVWDRLRDSSRALVGCMLYEHLRYLQRFPEKSDRAGNHYLINLAGFVFLEGVVFGHDHYERLIARDVWTDVAAQFDEEGLHIEHAPHYHRLCVETLAWILAFADRAGLRLPTAAAAVLRSSCEALVELEMPSVGLPVLGDCDSGQLLSFGAASRRVQYLRQLLGMAAGAPALLRAAAANQAALDGAEVLRSARRGHGISTIGPFVGARHGRFDVMLRSGPHGLFGRATHYHDDNGSPWVVFDDRDLLAEGGCFSYTRSFADRALDIASTGHNLITVSERLRYEPSPGSISPSVAAAPIAEWDSSGTAECVTLSVALQWDDVLAGQVQHGRSITLEGGPSAGMVVVDTVRLTHASEVVLRWHFAPEWRLSFLNPRVVLAETTDKTVALRVTVFGRSPLPAINLSVRSYRHSPRYGEALAAPVVEARVSGDDVRLISTFQPHRVGGQ